MGQKTYFGDFPFIASQHSLVAKHVTKDKWDQLKNITTKTSGLTLAKAIACAVQFNNQHCGIYAGDWDSYKDFAPVFDPLIQEYHGISPCALLQDPCWPFHRWLWSFPRNHQGPACWSREA